ncbi:MAG: thioredoxin family protein [Planctomycetes bacterium]|nr:thioredoxin family protein [Planctomycetota bacterium]
MNVKRAVLAFAAVALVALSVGRAAPPPLLRQGPPPKTTLSIADRYEGQAGSEFTITIDVDLPPGVYIDRRNFKPQVKSPEGWTTGAVRLPAGVTKSVGGLAIEVLTKDFSAEVSIGIPTDVAGAEQPLEVAVFYVTCTGDVCYPHTDTLKTTVVVAGVSSAAPLMDTDSEAAGAVTPTEPLDGDDADPTATATTSGDLPPSLVGEDEITPNLLEWMRSGAGSIELSFAGRIGEGLLNMLESGSYLPAIGLAFIGGILMAMTPCVLPMVPIVVRVLVGGEDTTAARRAISAVVFTFGLALVYAVLGLVAALTGGLIGGVLQSPYVLGGFAALFGVLALSMFGVFELEMPQSLQKKLRFQSKGNLAGAFVMGLVSGLIASPCIGPVIASALAYFANKQDAVLGFVTLFAMGIGIGTPFIIAGVVGGAVLKPGVWMNKVKKLLGIMLLLGSAYFVNLVGGWSVLLAAVGLWAIVALFALSRIDRPDRGTPQYERVTGTLQTGNWAIPVLLVFGFLWQGLPGAQDDSPIAWRHDVADAFVSASLEGKPVLLYFTATWCAPCKVLEHGIFEDEEVIEESRRFVCIKADMTDDSDPVVERLRQELRVSGPPVVFLYDQQTSGTLLGQIVP